MSKTIGIEEARKKLGDVIDEVKLKGDFYIISRKGTPSAAIVPLSVIQRREEAKKTLLAMIEDVHERNKGKRPEEIETIIKEAIESVRATKIRKDRKA